MPPPYRAAPKTPQNKAWLYRFEDEMLPLMFPLAATALLCGLGFLANLVLHKG